MFGCKEKRECISIGRKVKKKCKNKRKKTKRKISNKIEAPHRSQAFLPVPTKQVRLIQHNDLQYENFVHIYEYHTTYNPKKQI